jgi:hypothetical protein
MGPTIGPSTDPKNKGDTLYAGQFLVAGEYLQDKTKRYTAKIGEDYDSIHFSVLDNSRGVEVYSIFMPIHPSNVKLWMKPDGNLAIIANNGQIFWQALATSPNTSDQIKPNDNITRAFLQYDGNLILYNSLGKGTWSTHTGPL